MKRLSRVWSGLRVTLAGKRRRGCRQGDGGGLVAGATLPQFLLLHLPPTVTPRIRSTQRHHRRVQRSFPSHVVRSLLQVMRCEDVTLKQREPDTEHKLMNYKQPFPYHLSISLPSFVQLNNKKKKGYCI